MWDIWGENSAKTVYLWQNLIFWDEMSTSPQSTPAIKLLPALFGSFGIQLWYILLPAYFFFFMTAVYQPFGMATALDMGRGLFYFNTTMLMCIILVTLLLTRLLFWGIFRKGQPNWLGYCFWCFGELSLVAYFMALYLCLMGGAVTPYFTEVATCLQYSFLILFYPYFGITVVCAIIGYRIGQPDEEVIAKDHIRFTDSNNQVRIVLAAKSILFIRTEDNYVKIHYLDNGKVKDYLLRATMNSIAPLVEPHNLFRCQRSWFVNLSHIVALRKDPEDLITVELDAAGIKIPVSRAVYRDLSARL